MSMPATVREEEAAKRVPPIYATGRDASARCSEDDPRDGAEAEGRHFLALLVALPVIAGCFYFGLWLGDVWGEGGAVQRDESALGTRSRRDDYPSVRPDGLNWTMVVSIQVAALAAFAFASGCVVSKAKGSKTSKCRRYITPIIFFCVVGEIICLCFLTLTLGGPPNVPAEFDRPPNWHSEASKAAELFEHRAEKESRQLHLPPTNASRPAIVHPLLYGSDDALFTNTFTSCMDDPSCRVLYNHIQKTGGSFLASKLHPILDENEAGERTGRKYASKEWCCGEELWDRFQSRTEHFCSLKFGVYETNTLMFGDVVRACRRSMTKRTREVVLFTVRDPIQRTLSLINMLCNKEYRNRPREEQSICRRCNYEGGEGGRDSQFYNLLASDTLDIYTGFKSMIPATAKLLEEMTGDGGGGSRILILDDSDINAFFEGVEKHRNATLPKGRSNVGKTNRCNFQMPPEMRKMLEPASIVYRELLNGTLF